jgi:glycosyltransferase involved in cell wall biosynthesis
MGPNDEATALPTLSGVRMWRLDRRRAGVLPRLTWLLSALRRRGAAHIAKWLGVKTPLCAAELLVAPCALELLAMAALLRADVYHANDLDTLVPAAWAAKLWQRPYVYDAHELYADESPQLGTAERSARARVERTLSQKAMAVMTVSDLLADELHRRYAASRPIVVRNLPATVPRPPRRQRSDPHRPLRLLLHGAWVGLEQPGVDAALRAVAALPFTVLTLRGGVRDEEALAQRIAALGLSARVVQKPRLPGAEALAAAAIAEEHDIGLSVHLPDCQSRVLATSSKVFEYLMAGLCVVATDLPGNRHILSELAAPAQVGLFYAPGDAADLMAKLRSLHADPERLFAMQEAARQVAERSLCWEREEPRLHSIYDAL